MTRYPEVELRFLSAEPIVNGLGEAADATNPEDWPRYIRTTDIAGLTSLHADRRVTLPPDVARTAAVRRGDILMSAAGTIGKSYLHDSDEMACFAGYLVRWRVAKHSASERYMAYWTQSAHFLNQVATGVVRSTIDNYSAAKYRSTRAPVPPLDEQRRIADFLDAETAQIDALIAEQEHFIALLRERRTAAIAEGLSKLGGERTELRRVAAIQTGVTLSGPGDPEAPEWPYLRVANVQVGYVDLTTVTTLRLAREDAQTAMLRRGDVLMTEGGDIDKLGRGAIWKGDIEPILHQNHVFAVRPGPRLLPEFLVYWLDAPVARTYFYTTAKKTTNLASTNKTIVGRLPLALPTLDDQREFAKGVSEKSNQTDATIAEANNNVALLKERRAALITAAVTGQIDVTMRRAV